jgi:hypothetical protein
MNKRTLVVLLALLGLSPRAALSADIAASWLEIPTSTRQAALSGAVGAMVDDVDALGVNPAGLAELSGNEAELLHNIWVQNLTVEHLAYGHGFGNWGFALGGDYFNFGQVDFYSLNSSGNPVANGSFSPMGLDLYGGLGLILFHGLELGVDGKFIMENLLSGMSSSTEALDAGLKYKNYPTGLAASVALLNLGGTLEGSNLPSSVDMAGSYVNRLSPDHLLSLGLDGNLSLNESTASTASLGTEYWYRGTIALRVGYRLAGYGNLQGLAGLSAGVGVKLEQAELDYALTTLGDLGSGSQISLSYRFGPFGTPILPAPEGLNYDMDEGAVILHWNGVQDKRVAGYNFYVKKSESDGFRQANKSLLVETTLTLKKMKPGKAYIFGITTVNVEGGESPMATITIAPTY